jgi:hypothetical protein
MACNTNWEDKCILVEDISEKARRRGPIGRPKRRTLDNIKLDLRLRLDALDISGPR